MKQTLLFLLAFWTFALLPAPTVRAQDEDHSPNSTGVEGFCAQFEVVTNAAPLSFKPLRGKVAGLDTWKGQQALPGTTKCIVFGRRGAASYSCSTPTVRGDDRAQEVFDTLKVQVQKSLGSGWAANDYTARHGEPSIAFWKDHAAYDVRVVLKSLEGENKEVTLTVSRP
jgi:hypothetical protein